MNTRKTVYGAIILAIAIALPGIFHSTGIPGNIFLPMHLPIFIGGMLLGPLYGMLLGVLAPIINFFIFTMPPIPILYIMVFELMAYGLVSGLIYKKTNKLFLSLIISMIIGRIVAAIVVLALTKLLAGFDANPLIWFKGSFVTALPGILLQLFLVPIIVSRTQKSIKEKF
ncbi:ECF transporter S component [Lagierella sp.]|uniref:ECF transporter S component n=1 Tax=Lagierella sp. TaxID=2849657 RepID=UPI002606A757|nr:ECF transporter S component [Lagierella sp.]